MVSQTGTEPYYVDFYGEYKHKDGNCEELGKTRWRPTPNGALAREAEKMGNDPFDKEECPHCWY